MTRKIKDAKVVFKKRTRLEPEPEQLSPMSSGMVGCLRGTLAICGSVVCALAAGIAIGIQAGVGLGILTGIVLLIILMIGSAYIMNTAKQLTVVDCLLPLPIGAISAFLFMPVGFISASFFSAVTCLGASLFLTIMLFMYRAKKVPGWFLLIPFFVFIYEILPIELPTDLDNFFCFGGNGINLVAGMTFNPIKRMLLGHSNDDR